jgi:hypothetical protein
VEQYSLIPSPPRFITLVVSNRFLNQLGSVHEALQFLRTGLKRPCECACNTPNLYTGDRVRRKKKFVLGIMVINILVFSSCSSIQAGFYSFFIDSNREFLVENEPKVKVFLKNIVDSYEQYSVKVYARTATRFGMKRTRLLTHSYYLIIRKREKEYHTLSFYGTKMEFYSEGVWALDTETDMESYKKYLEGNNKYDVIEVFTEDVIDARRTIRNIIDRIDSNVTYYYNDHIKDKGDVDNCNTALYETVALEGKGENKSTNLATDRTLGY